MDERVIQFRVGVVVVAAAGITVILVLLFGALPTIQPQYTLHIRFPEAPGVAVDTPVRKSGVQIGRVSDVRLMDDGGVVLSMRINDSYRLRQNETCRISTGSLVTGDAVLEWVRSPDPNRGKEPLSDGEFLTNGELESDPFQVLINLEGDMSSAFASIQSAAQSIETASDEVGRLVRGMTTTVDNNEDQLKRIMQKTEVALDQFQTTMTTIDDVVGDPKVKQGLEEAVKGVPELFRKSQQTLDDVQRAMAGFQVVTEKAKTNLDNLEGFTRPLKERGGALVQDVEQAIGNLDNLLLELTEFSKSLNDSEGTIGQLVHNPELYNRLNRAVANVEDVSRQLKPIVNDVRIFTDKIARDPRQLGVKGALDRRPSGAGLKFRVREGVERR